jgi:HipA-like protein
MSENPLPAGLWVYMGQDRVGMLYPTDPLSFEYSAEWIASADSKPLHPHIKVMPGRLSMPELHAFLENLLPEGATQNHWPAIPSVFGFRAPCHGGGDTAGSKMPCCARDRPYLFNPAHKGCAKLVTPTPDCFVADHHATLE